MSSTDIDFRLKSITIYLSNVIDHYRLLSETIVVVLQVNHRHNVVCKVLLSHSIIIACNRFTIINKILLLGTKTITGMFWSFYRSSASSQFIIREEEEIAAKVAVYNPRLVSL